MLIQTMSEAMSIDLLRRAWLGHLACCHEGRPYVVPVGYAYQDHHLYCCATEGQKIAWMRSNPTVCVEIEEIVNRQEWETVVLYGTFEELPDRPDTLDARIETYERLARAPGWWQPAFSPTLRSDGERPVRPLFFRIVINEMVGHRGLPADRR